MVLRMDISLHCFSLPFGGVYAGALLVASLHFVFNGTVDKGEQGVVSTEAHVRTRHYPGTPLSNEDRPCAHPLGIVPLDPKPLPRTVPSVSGASPAFFVCHALTYRCSSVTLMRCG
jgi:hypothetical protein